MDLLDKYLNEEKIINRYAKYQDLSDCISITITITYQPNLDYTNLINKIYFFEQKRQYQFGLYNKEIITLHSIATIDLLAANICVYKIEDLIDSHSDTIQNIIKQELTSYYDNFTFAQKIIWTCKHGLIIVNCILV